MGKAKKKRRHDESAASASQPSHPFHRSQGHQSQSQSHQAAQGRRPSAAEHAATADRMIAEAVFAKGGGDTAAWHRLVSQITDREDVPGWQQIAWRALSATLDARLKDAWRRGWQPADVARAAGRRLEPRHVRLMTDAVVAELRGYAATTIDERWHTQLDALDARVWWSTDAAYPLEWCERERAERFLLTECALETVHLLTSLPVLERLSPVPGTARPAATDGSSASGRAVEQRILNRARMLLAKAESTTFPEEAETFTAGAQALMARHSIDAAMLAADAGDPEAPSGVRVGIDNPYESAKASLLQVVAEANRCRAVWDSGMGHSTVLGFPADLANVELLFTSLLVQATSAMLAAGGRQDSAGRSRTRAFRQSFLMSYAHRIGERLSAAAGRATDEAVAAAADGDADVPRRDLLPVLAARDLAVEAAAQEMFPELTRRRARISDYEGWLHGRAAADRAALHPRTAVAGS